ncbi:type I-E CRISPR-associated protein Cas6/Cse3/CasE [Lachnoanaerobaculum sp.]
MYISRVELDIYNRQKIRDLTHLGAYHNWVEQSFREDNGVRSRKLWRLDKINDKKYLLLVSGEKPDLKLLEKYGVTGSAVTKEYDEYISKIKNGMKLRFRLVTNPVHAVMEDGKRGSEKPHITAEFQKKFFMERTIKNGFEVNEDEVNIVERGFEILRKSGSKPVKVVKATFEGVLTVVDEDKFKLLLESGFGKKKAYGFGLMTVIPI